MKVKKIKNSQVLSKVVFACLFCALGWYLHGKFSPPSMGGAQGPQEVYVFVKGLKKADISSRKKYIAQTEAINSVDIIPQVSGYLEEILFKDGAFVAQNDRIFTIEQRKYKADLSAAEASVKQLRNEYKRIRALNKSRDVSDRELEIAESNLQKAEAALDLARLNLEYTEIKAPIAGVIGKALVTKGNLVGPTTPSLARIIQMQPIRIAFSLSDKERSEFLKKKDGARDIFADIVMPNGTTETISVDNIFFDNEMNPDTATIPVYIDFANADNLLVPGNYVDIYVKFKSDEEALLVPQTALAADIEGSYVMTVSPEGIVEKKYVSLGDVIEDAQVVLSGLSADDKVIVQGLQKARPGLKVKASEIKEEGK